MRITSHPRFSRRAGSQCAIDHFCDESTETILGAVGNHQRDRIGRREEERRSPRHQITDILSLVMNVPLFSDLDPSQREGIMMETPSWEKDAVSSLNTNQPVSLTIDEYLRERLMPVEGVIPHLAGIDMYGNTIPAATKFKATILR